MTLATPADREFRVNPAGYVRDKIVLASFREGLRALTNPETGQPFTEEEIARATRSPGRWFVEAQAIDDYGQQQQRNALYLADQIRFDRATGKWLIDYHGRLWDVSLLDATGGSGPVTVNGTPGTIVVGSTTIPDDSAYKACDAAGNLYQAFQTAVLANDGTGNGVATVTMAAIGTGETTNLPALAADGTPTVLTWTQRDPNMSPTATVADDFTGGTDQETEAELADRIAAIVQFRPGAGNDSHQRTWARESSNAVEDGFVYPCALHAGSVVVAITQKRKSAVGPNGRIPSASTMAAAIAYLTSPTSPVVPSRTFEVAVPANPESSDVVIQLGMQRASKTGWTDAQPFPAFNSFTPRVSVPVVNMQFTMSARGDATLPGQAAGATLNGSSAPQMMLWNAAKSAWELLSIAWIHDQGGNLYLVTLSSLPSFTMTSGMFISPATSLAPVIAQAMTNYFDELGPGDFFDVTSDARGQRCLRFPSNIDQWPITAGADIVTDVLAALGSTTANGQLASMSKTSPSFQPSPQTGPNMLVLGNAGIYAL